jgi:hypothetical protein
MYKAKTLGKAKAAVAAGAADGALAMAG